MHCLMEILFSFLGQSKQMITSDVQVLVMEASRGFQDGSILSEATGLREYRI